MPLVAYYARGADGQPESVSTFGALRKVLEREQDASQSAIDGSEIKRGFLEAVERFRNHDLQVIEQAHKARIASLTESIRQLLLLAAYIELAQRAAPGLFDDPDDAPFEFSVEAIHRLKRHKIPFAGALKLVDVSDLRPHPDDPKYIRQRDSYPDVLTRRFDATRARLGETLSQLVQARKAGSGGRELAAAPSAEAIVQIY
jgi:hypothetical protein